jgi:TetR/AcrR family transcriptional regulator, transcriptional repressor for nem operon
MNDTKEYIIDQAYRLFLNHSYEAVSINDISHAIGLTKGALYHHFKNKEELFKSVIDKYVQFECLLGDIDHIALAEYNKLSIEQTDKILKRMFGQFTEFVATNYVALVSDAFRHYPEFAERMNSFISSETAKTKKVLDNAINRGEIRNDIDTTILAGNYMATTIGMAGNIIHNKTVDEVVELLRLQLQELYKLLKK